MEFLITVAVGVLTACSVYLVLRPRSFSVVLGLTLMTYAVNLFLFVSGRLTLHGPPLIIEGVEVHTDPLPQALVLTAIVISFGMTAFLVVLGLKAYADLGNDHVDGHDAAAPEERR